MTRSLLVIVWGLAASAGLAQAAGDAQAGEAVFKNKVGPSLGGIAGPHFAAVSGYAYSDALKKADKSWDDQTLDT